MTTRRVVCAAAALGLASAIGLGGEVAYATPRPASSAIVPVQIDANDEAAVHLVQGPPPGVHPRNAQPRQAPPPPVARGYAPPPGPRYYAPPPRAYVAPPPRPYGYGYGYAPRYYAPGPRPYYGPRTWAYRPWYQRPYYGTIIGGIALGSIIAVAAYGIAPPPPSPDLCWFWADQDQASGYWDYC